ncbi:MAG: energy transducer TonB [Flavobacterium sp.]
MEISHKKESLAITSALFAVLFSLLFYFTFNGKNMIPNLEGGGGGGEIAVNFGNSELGSGKNFESIEIVQSAPKSRIHEQIRQEELVTNANDDDVPVVASTKKIKKEETKNEVTKPVEVPKKPSKSTSDALSNLLNGSSKGGDGDDNVSGNKGKIYGDPKASGYNGGGGSGTGSGGGNGSGQGLGTGSGYGNGYGDGKGSGVGNYQLSGRKAVTRPQPKYTCNEEGTVAVEISVNSSGIVTSAIAGVKGTTNTARCLLDQAKLAAMNTKFDANSSAPEKQVGKIIYNFRLTE